MLNLIVKDLVFNARQVLIGLLMSMFGFLTILDGPKYAAIGLFMVPALLFSQIVGKSCYMEDKDNAFKFLKSLPISKNNVVLSKYVECIITLVCSYVFMYLVNLALTSLGLSKYVFNFNLVAYMASVLLLYFSVYLWIFFKYNFASAQHSTFFILMGSVAFYKIQDYLKITSIKIPGFFTGINTSYTLFAVALAAFIVLIKLSINAFLAKE